MLRLLLKICLFTIAIGTIQYIYWSFFPKSKIHEPFATPTFLELNEDLKKDFDIVLCGSSVNEWKGKGDKDQRKISEILEDTLNSCSVIAYDRPAGNIDIFDDAVPYIRESQKEEKLYLVEISHEAFCEAWHLDPKWAHTLKKEELALKSNIESIFYIPLSIFKYNFGILNDDEYQNIQLFNGDTFLGSFKQVQKFRRKEMKPVSKWYYIQYMTRLNENNKLVKRLTKFASYAKVNDIRILFYITPVNYEGCREHIEDDFDEVFNYNNQFLVNIFKTHNLDYLDLSKSLKAEHFTHNVVFPNGHLDEKGRQYVAYELSRKINCN